MLLPKRGFVMVENRNSKRKTQSMVSFCGTDRFYENQALMKFYRNNCETYSYLGRFWKLEQNLPDEKKVEFLKLHFENRDFWVDENGVKFESKWPKSIEFNRNKKEGEKDFLRLEEVYAIML